MKKIILTLFVSNFLFSQVAIGKATVDGSGILDFAAGTTKGIILPNIIDNTLMTNVTPGTLVFDLATAKIKYYDGFWRELSTNVGTSPTLLSGNDLPVNNGMIIGDPTATAQGVLVLESDSQALILPKITDPVNNVKSPVAGMMCYDPVKKLMCVFNGKEWFFWQ